MKQSFHFIAFFFLCCISLQTKAQNKVAVETIQSYSTILPNANYWHINVINRDQILAALDSGLFKSLLLDRAADIEPNLLNLNKTSQLGKIEINWNKSRQIPYHAYVELYEMEPRIAYNNGLLDIPQLEKDSIITIWFVTCSIFDQNKTAIFKKTVLMRIGQSQTIGIGLPIAFPLSSPTNMFMALSKGIAQVSPILPDMAYLKAKSTMLYAIDNLWMPYAHKAPRIRIDTNKSFIAFSLQGNTQLLRTSIANTQKINLKDKSAENIDYLISNAIKASTKIGRKEYYRIYQPLRDVYHNIDYSIASCIVYNPDASTEDPATNPITFLNDSLNKIYINNELIGQFSVTENYTLIEKWANLNVLYNGYDSTEKYDLNTSFKRHSITAEKRVSGNYKNSKFSILFNYEANLKTIFVDDQMACIIQGEKRPTQMVLIQNNLADDYLNFLILFSESELFKMPSLN